MALNVITNVFSLNAQRHLNRSGSNLAKSLERLSSGLRINRAADDAAGLAISQTLVAQIRGLNQAARNANDGISLLSTAEGASEEATSLLQRIRELAVQSANDTNSTTNRGALDKEVQALLSELDRIASTVEFNGTKLLDGSFTAKQIQVGAFAGQSITVNLTSIRTNTLGQIIEANHAGGAIDNNSFASGDVTINGVDVGTSTDGSAKSKATAINAASTGALATALTTSLVAAQGATAALDFSGGQTGNITINGILIDLNGTNYTADTAGRTNLINKLNLQEVNTGVRVSFDGSGVLTFTAADGRNVTLTTTGGDGADLGTGEALGLVADGGGTEEDQASALLQQSTITLTSETNIVIVLGGSGAARSGFTAAEYATVSTGNLVGLDVKTQASSDAAIKSIDAALKQIADTRSNIGALTNRLESTIRSVQAISENLSASNSRIRDADFAAETASLTRNQILQQAGIAILAQANAVPQLALSLLQ